MKLPMLKDIMMDTTRPCLQSHLNRLLFDINIGDPPATRVFSICVCDVGSYILLCECF